MLSIKGIFHWEVIGLNGQCRAWGSFPNGVTDTAINDLLDTHFRNGSPNAAWYMSLISSTSYVELDDDDDTMSSHSGWIEEESYDEATRPTWAPSAAANQKLDTTSAVQFTMNTEKTIKGLFITSENTIGGTTGTLWATGLIPAAVSVKPGEVFRGYYDLTAAEG